MRYANVFKITKEVQGSRRTKEMNLNTKLFCLRGKRKKTQCDAFKTTRVFLRYTFEFFTINYIRTCPVHPERRATLRSDMPIDNAS